MEHYQPGYLYTVEYTNGKRYIKEFKSIFEAINWKQSEGDHLVSMVRIFSPDEENP